MPKELTPAEQTVMDRHVGRCMERLEQLRLEPTMLSVIRDIVRKEMRFLAENLSEAHDDQS